MENNIIYILREPSASDDLPTVIPIPRNKLKTKTTSSGSWIEGTVKIGRKVYYLSVDDYFETKTQFYRRKTAPGTMSHSKDYGSVDVTFCIDEVVLKKELKNKHGEMLQRFDETKREVNNIIQNIGVVEKLLKETF